MGQDADRTVGRYFRYGGRELPPADGSERPSDMAGTVPIDDAHRSPAGGLVLPGLLTTLDSMGGLLCGLSVLPRWIVTTSLVARVHRPEQVGPLRLAGTVLRQGRAAVVGDLTVTDEGRDDEPVASAVITCSVLEPDGLDLRFDRPVVIPVPPVDPAAPDLETFFRIGPTVGDTTRLDVADHLRNPWGILHGGAVAALVDAAACRAAQPTPADPVVATDIELHYLSPVRTGPAEARAAVIGVRHDATVVRVAVHDTGRDDRLAAVASVLVRPVTGRATAG